VKRLWVELLRKPFDLIRVDAERCAGEDLADIQVVKKQIVSFVAIHSSTFGVSRRAQATVWVRWGTSIQSTSS